MKRSQFLTTMAMMTMSNMMNLKSLHAWTKDLGHSQLMPTIFFGHGSPMNAIQDNDFTKAFKNVGHEITKPKAIICVSAHWETRGTKITAMQHPRTIHDFGGFPRVLHEIQYPVKGNPALAQETATLISMKEILLDHEWGLDHGTWSVLRHVYPDADIPVLQLSIDVNMSFSDHYALAQELKQLRSRGILVIGSGNMVHNLGMVDWARLDEQFAFDWALEASDIMKNIILKGSGKELLNLPTKNTATSLAIPTPEHFIPLLYVMGLKDEKDEVSLFNDIPVAGSLTMTSVILSH
jgi:4,5-DOPA dioxygenase extradiol